jgi:hypothetical protein
VAVHLPKTAGTSLRLALEAAYGAGMATDYADHPLQHGRGARRGHALAQSLRWAGRRLPHRCVYGHFLPVKYALARDTFFSIWLRDPVQRVVSRYHHYLRACAAGETVHARWGLVPGLSLEDFVRLPHYQDTLSEYLWAFPIRRFAFVGRVEQWDRDAPRLFAGLGLGDPLTAMANRNPDREADAYAVTTGERALIERMNRRDLLLHERLLALGS